MISANTRFLDKLEPRRLFSATVVDGMLVVVGTNGPDRIVMWEDEGATGPVIVGFVDALLFGRPPETFEVPAEGVRSILVRALAGNDTVDLFDAPVGPSSNSTSLPSRIDAGLGKDVVTGGVGRDVIFGGFGNDRINGGRGNDWIDGGWGNDELHGGDGNDYVSGSYGDDDVTGDEGDDRLSGGAGNDHVGFNAVGPLVSEPGNDVLSGGPGEDWMVGGAGKDRIYGGTGRDHFSLEDDDSEMLDRTPDEPKDVPQGV
jgi:Ca2+-binding RTX toxin-like protein